MPNNLSDTLVMTNLDKKEVEFTLTDSEQSLEHTVGLVNSVAQINILAEYEIIGTDLIDNETSDPVSWIKAVPNGKVPALDLSGKLAQEIMKGKYDGVSVIAPTYSATLISGGIALYSFDFRDYMNMWPLGIPEEAKDLYIKVTLPKETELYTGTGTITSVIVKLTIQVLMDESCNGSIGYRQYLERAEGFGSNDSTKSRKIKLSRSGFLDSIMLYNEDPSGLPVEDIEVIKDVTEYPVKSTLVLEQMKASLVNANFITGLTNIDLVRPLDAQGSRSLDLNLKFGTITEDKDLRIVTEYVFIDPALIMA
jgi:hypothetical protein